MQVYQILKQNPKAINQIVPSYLQRSLWWRAQLMWVSVK
jgi:hypothetical protein